MSVPNRRARVAITALATLCLASTPAFAQTAAPDGRNPIGSAIQIVRQVTGEIQAQFRYLLRRDPVYRDEVIATQPESASRIVFEDRTELSVGPSARITLDEFVFDPDPSIGKFFLSAFDGVFRFKSGKLAKTAYAIETPTAVIGVRGTTFATVFGPNGLAAVVLEAGDAVIVDIAASCPNVDAERIINVRDFAVVVDGCDISEPAPPPAWALEQIALLNGLLFELDRELGNIDIGPDNDSGTPIQDAGIQPGEIPIQPASAPAVASGPPTPLTPPLDDPDDTRVGFTHNDEDDDDGPSGNGDSGGSASASADSSSNASSNSSGGNGSSNASSNSSSNASSSSSGGKSSSNASSNSSSNASSSSSGGNSSSNASSNSSSNASSSSSGGKSSSNASSHSSSNASSSSSGGKSSSNASSNSSSNASSSSSGGNSSSSASSRSSSTASSSSSGGSSSSSASSRSSSSASSSSSGNRSGGRRGGKGHRR